MSDMAVNCAACKDTGFVCENHPGNAWSGTTGEDECCGGAGMPCPECCEEIPQDGTRSITDAFIPGSKP